MNRWLISFLSPFANWKHIGLLMGSVVLVTLSFYEVGKAFQEAMGHYRVPDTLGFVGAADIIRCIQQMGHEGQSLYLQIAWLDVLYPILYTLLFSLILLWMLDKKGMLEHPICFILWIPILGGMADLIENTCFVPLVMYAAEPNFLIAQIAALAHIAKWILVGISVLLALFGIAMKIWGTKSGKS